MQINIPIYIVICTKQWSTSLFLFVNNNSATLGKIKTFQIDLRQKRFENIYYSLILILIHQSDILLRLLKNISSSNEFFRRCEILILFFNSPALHLRQACTINLTQIVIFVRLKQCLCKIRHRSIKKSMGLDFGPDFNLNLIKIK